MRSSSAHCVSHQQTAEVAGTVLDFGRKWGQSPVAAILGPVPGKPPARIGLRWIDGLAFAVRVGDRETVLDGESKAGLSPVELLGAALAGCMATDVAWILKRARQDLRALDVSLSADRAAEAPHRFVNVRIHFAVTGPVDPAQLDRAIELSHDKYCSVWHTLRQDLPLELTSSITPA